MEFIDLARNRYSERNFSSAPVEEEKLYKELYTLSKKQEPSMIDKMKQALKK